MTRFAGLLRSLSPRRAAPAPPSLDLSAASLLAACHLHPSHARALANAWLRDRAETDVLTARDALAEVLERRGVEVVAPSARIPLEAKPPAVHVPPELASIASSLRWHAYESARPLPGDPTPPAVNVHFRSRVIVDATVPLDDGQIVDMVGIAQRMAESAGGWEGARAVVHAALDERSDADTTPLRDLRPRTTI